MTDPDDLTILEETLAFLSDPQEVQGLAKAESEVASGDVIRGVDAVRALEASPFDPTDGHS